MFPLDVLSPKSPTYRLAGRFGIDVLGLLWPTDGKAKGEGVRLCAHGELSRLSSIDGLFGQDASLRVPHKVLRDHVLIVRPRGEFFSTDELTLTQMRRDDDHWAIDLEITRVETPNGIPAPRDLYVVLAINTGDHPPQHLELRFSGHRRDSQGNETPLAEPVSPPQVIEFSE